jgi:hypothetical protein
MQKGDIFSEQNFKLQLKSSVPIEINFLKSAFSQTLFPVKSAFFLETPILRRPVGTQDYDDIGRISNNAISLKENFSSRPTE